MANCHICAEMASGSCARCGKIMCDVHEVMYVMSSYCARSRRKLRIIMGLVGCIIFIVVAMVVLSQFLNIMSEFPF